MTKRFAESLYIFCIATLILTLLSGLVFAQEQGVRVFVDGVEVDFPDQKPFVNTDNRTLVPARFVSQALGAAVNWTDATKTVRINYKEKVICLQIGAQSAGVGETSVILDTAPTIANNRTMVPLRFVSECLGGKVCWEQVGETGMINIFTKGQNEAEIQAAIAGSKNIIESGYMGELWGYDNPSGKMPDPAAHDARVAADKASVTSDLRIVTPASNDNADGLDLDMQIKMWLPLEPQYIDAERLLTARIGSGARQVIEYVRIKPDRFTRLSTKEWTINKCSVQVIECAGGQGIGIRVYYAQQG